MKPTIKVVFNTLLTGRKTGIMFAVWFIRKLTVSTWEMQQKKTYVRMQGRWPNSQCLPIQLKYIHSQRAATVTFKYNNKCKENFVPNMIIRVVCPVERSQSQKMLSSCPTNIFSAQTFAARTETFLHRRGVVHRNSLS